jgi:hypothetical protein
VRNELVALWDRYAKAVGVVDRSVEKGSEP